jgi:hypothetical protein
MAVGNARFAQPDHVAVFRLPDAGVADTIQGRFQPADGDHGLGVEGGGALNDINRLSGIMNKEKMLQSGRQLVLATLAGFASSDSTRFKDIVALSLVVNLVGDVVT